MMRCLLCECFERAVCIMCMSSVVCLMGRGELCSTSVLPTVTGLYNLVKAFFRGVSLSGVGAE